MKLIFNFNGKRFEVSSSLVSTNDIAKKEGVVINEYDVNLSCDGKTATFPFSDFSEDISSPKEMSEDHLLRALTFMAQDVSDYVGVQKKEDELVKLNEWENMETDLKSACIDEVLSYYKIFDYLVNDDSQVDNFENLVGGMWLNGIGYEITD